MLSVGWRALIWLLIISISFVSYRGNFFFQNQGLALLQRLWLVFLSLVFLFHLPATSVCNLDISVHNFCGKTSVSIWFCISLHIRRSTKWLTTSKQWLLLGKGGLFPASLHLSFPPFVIKPKIEQVLLRTCTACSFYRF